MIPIEQIKQIDGGNMLDTLSDFVQQCTQAHQLSKKVFVNLEFANINGVVCIGMGGSGIGAYVAKEAFIDNLSTPIELVNDYKLPAWIDRNTLCIGVSYSGNTQETLSAVYSAAKYTKNLILISSGGKLRDFAQEGKFKYLNVPSGFVPRAAFGYLCIPIMWLFSKLFNVQVNFSDVFSSLSQLNIDCRTNVADKNQAMALAKAIKDKLVLIYGISGVNFSACLRLKTQLNENAKTFAYAVAFPEGAHNEIVSWQDSISIPTAVIFVNDENISGQLKVQLNVVKEFAQKYATVLEIKPQNNLSSDSLSSKVCKLLWLIHLFDWISFYLAILRKVDPTPIPPIDYMKQKLATLAL